MGLRTKIALLLVLLASATAYGEPPISLLPGMRAIFFEVQDDFAELPGTFVDIYVLVPASPRTRATIVLEKEVYTNKEAVLEASETVLFHNVRMLSHTGPSRGIVAIAIDEAKVEEVMLLREKYRDKLRARVVK